MGERRAHERARSFGVTTRAVKERINVNERTGRRACLVELDFRFKDRGGVSHVVDVKGFDNAKSILKRALVETFYPDVNVEIWK